MALPVKHSELFDPHNITPGEAGWYVILSVVCLECGLASVPVTMTEPRDGAAVKVGWQWRVDHYAANPTHEEYAELDTHVTPVTMETATVTVEKKMGTTAVVKAPVKISPETSK